jgi:hypothetical protein
MASNSDVFFSVQVMLQIQATASHSIIFGDFPEMMTPKSPLTFASSSEVKSFQGSTSNLTLFASITHRVDELSITDRPRAMLGQLVALGLTSTISSSK